MKKFVIILCLLCSGCSCNNEDITALQVIKPTDKYLNCNKLNEELLLADFAVRENISRMDAATAYAKNPTCLISAKLQIERAQNMAENRVDYLQMLIRNKGCILR
ncbi:MAG: hypothetical protein LW825_05505 [Candidatus Jidaibacter sp.]|jgi:hypothetical protein|nr:hypothetical protein [Candidatus Jidaibacter sp.]